MLRYRAVFILYCRGGRYAVKITRDNKVNKTGFISTAVS